MATAQAFINDIVNRQIAYARELTDLTEDAASEARVLAQGRAVPAPLGDTGASINPPGTDAPVAFGEQGFYDIDDPPWFTDGFVKPNGEPIFNENDLREFYHAVLADLPDPPPDIETDDLFDATVPSAINETLPEIPDVLDDDLTGIPTLDPLNDIQAPALQTLNVPASPTITTPEFSADDPGLPPELTDDLRAEYDQELHSRLPQFRTIVDDATTAFINQYFPGHTSGMVALEDRIDQDLAGGTGYSTVVRQAILDRARSEIVKGLVAAERAAFESAARRGFVLPPGAVATAVLEAETEVQNRVAVAELEIAKQTADQEQANARSSIQIALQLRTSVLSAANQYAGTILGTIGQAVDSAQGLLRALTAAFEARVAAYRATLDYYRAKLALFETLMKIPELEIAIFEANIRAEELKGRFNSNLIEKMRAEIEAERTKVLRFDAAMRPVEAEIRRRTQITASFEAYSRAFINKLQARAEEYRRYQAQIAADRSILDARIANQGAYGDRIRALEAKNNAEVSKQQAITTHNRSVLDQFAAEYRNYQQTVDVAKIDHTTRLTDHTTRMQVFRDRIDQLAKKAGLDLEGQRINADHAIKKAQLDLEYSIEWSKAVNGAIDRSAEVSASAAESYAHAAAAALSATGTMAAETRQVTAEEAE